MKKEDISSRIQILLNHFNTKNFIEVINKGKILLKKNPEYVILYNLIGSAYQNSGAHHEAQNYFKKGLKLDHNNLAIMNNLAMTYKNLLQYEVAEDLYSKIININSKYLNAFINLGNLKRDLNQFEDAIKLYEKALKITNNNPVVYYSLALAHQGIGNFEKAINYSLKTLEIDPKFTRADHLISQSKKYDKNDTHYISLKKKINEINPKSLEMVDLYFSLSKAEEDLKNIKEAAEYMILGNKLKKNLSRFDITDDIKLIRNIKKSFNNFDTNILSSNIKDKIIFILGMPRSGTSLVEQIISSHSNVFGCGELPILSKIIKNNFLSEKSEISDISKNINDNPLLLNKLRKEYSNFIKNFKIQDKYITDKAPLNFRWIGFIKLIFPKAKIIHCHRDPKNNCFSIFKNLFEGGLYFSYDQDDLVQYYNLYSDLMNFWKLKYENSILDVKYENLVSNNINEIKKILEFCDLDYQEKCLFFHKNKTPIKTMSTAQARKPIYKTSINSFEKYSEYLKTLNNLK